MREQFNTNNAKNKNNNYKKIKKNKSKFFNKLL